MALFACNWKNIQIPRFEWGDECELYTIYVEIRQTNCLFSIEFVSATAQNRLHHSQKKRADEWIDEAYNYLFWLSAQSRNE